jgi:hypothetical protein
MPGRFSSDALLVMDKPWPQEVCQFAAVVDSTRELLPTWVRVLQTTDVSYR